MPKSLACSAPECSRASARTCSKTRSSSISTVSTIAVRRSRWCTGPVRSWTASWPPWARAAGARGRCSWMGSRSRGRRGSASRSRAATGARRGSCTRRGTRRIGSRWRAVARWLTGLRGPSPRCSHPEGALTRADDWPSFPQRIPTPRPRGVFIGVAMFGPKTQCVVVVGAQWGDEGKGKIVDVLAERADLVVRYQGGANAGHTVDTGEGKSFVLHQIPSGILQGAVCVVGNGVVLDPEQMFAELDALEGRGVRTEHKLHVSDRAHLTLPYHKLLDRAREKQEKIGTTGRGIGPTYEDKYGRRGVRVGDLRNLAHAKELVRTRVAAANQMLGMLGAGSGEQANPEEHVRLLERLAPRLLPLAVDAGRGVRGGLSRGGSGVLGGGPGGPLGVDPGTLPYVTSSNTTAGGA